jgi:hypothetical protein
MIIRESKGFAMTKINFVLGNTDGGVIHATRQRFSMTLFGTEIVKVTRYAQLEVDRTKEKRTQLIEA